MEDDTLLDADACILHHRAGQVGGHSGPKSHLRRNIYFSCNQFNFGCHIGYLCSKKCVP